MGFFIDKLNRSAASGIKAGLLRIMLLDAAGETVGDAGVEGGVAALNYVDVPGHGLYILSVAGYNYTTKLPFYLRFLRPVLFCWTF